MDLTGRLDSLEAALLIVARLEFGDLPGHPFRGNQYSDGGGPTDPENVHVGNVKGTDHAPRGAVQRARDKASGHTFPNEHPAQTAHWKGVQEARAKRDSVAKIEMQRGEHTDKYIVTDKRTGQSTSHTSRMDAERRAEKIARLPVDYRPHEGKPGEGYGTNHSDAEHAQREELRRWQEAARSGAHS